MINTKILEVSRILIFPNIELQNLCVKVYYKLTNIQLWPKSNFQLYFLEFIVS